MQLKNKIIVVTGSGSGIGRSCALEIARCGAKIVLADINLEAAIKTVSLITATGGTACAFETDVSDEGSVQRLVSYCVEMFGGVDGLINNAAIQVNQTVEHTSFADWNRQMAINVGGVFLCSKYFIPLLRKSKGSIVNMSSVNAFYTEPACAGYCATKSAIIGLTKAMAIDHGQDGIRVNAICPGYIDAGLAEGYFESQKDPALARQNAGKLHALGRIGRADEVAKAAIFLLSDDASFVTGSSLVADGGFGSGMPPS
jgi:NAD(P)-dependent dehydrogenase (short-subunit alcohol dehydrogenase family)